MSETGDVRRETRRPRSRHASRVTRFWRSLLFASIPAVAACKLTETEIAPGERTVVVQAVIDRSQAQQFLLLERSNAGDTNVVSAGGGNRVPPARPRFPVTGATVVVEHLAGACTGQITTFIEVPPTPPSVIPTGRYAGAPTCLLPGERLGLMVTTPQGELVTGETTIPGADSHSVRAGAAVARFIMDTVRFDRERDTMRVAMTASIGRGMQIEIRRAENHDHIAAEVINDSLGVAFPGNIIDPFEGDSGETTFRAGAYYLMTVAMADTNYFDYARTFSDPITGRGFLNHLTGGLGVFGSIETAQYMLRVVGSVNDPKEGVYRITGVSGTTNLDITIETYLDDFTGNEFSAFVKGAWVNGAVDVSGDGSFGYQPGFTANSPDAFQFAFEVVRPTNPTFRRYLLRGVRSATGSSFAVDVIGTSGNGQTVLRVTASGVQVSGPGS